MMKHKKIRKIILVFLILLSAAVSGQAQQTTVLGGSNGWNDDILLLRSTDIRKSRDVLGWQYVLLRHAEYQPGSDTDFLLHANEPGKIRDETWNYRIRENSARVVRLPQYKGGGVLSFTGKDRMVATPLHSKLFAEGQFVNDFTIEFSMKPESLHDGETILKWAGVLKYQEKLIHQEFTVLFRDRRLVWRFDNMFLKAPGTQYEFVLKGNDRLLPGKWHHHMVRFNSSTGYMEYCIDGMPASGIYVNESRKQNGIVFARFNGIPVTKGLVIGSGFTGKLDEIRIENAYVNTPSTGVYEEGPGVFISRILDLGRQGSVLDTITADSTEPMGSKLFYSYIIKDHKPRESVLASDPDAWNMFEQSDEWIPFNPGEPLPEPPEGRYVQLKVEFYPNGDSTATPRLDSITIEYTRGLQPLSPLRLTGEAGDGSVTLSWVQPPQDNIKGYLVFYGTSPGNYYADHAIEGVSPVDAGKVSRITLTGLENRTLYYFTVAAYTDSTPRQMSSMSNEVYARPDGVPR